MSIGEYIRNSAFTLFDSLKKESINKYVKELESFEASGYDYLIVSQKLIEFLTRAKSSSPFYDDKKNEFDLSTYPVVTKKFLSNHETRIIAGGFVREKLIKVSTSGSYGTPFSFYLTSEKKKRQLAEVIHYGKPTGYEVGVKHGYFRTALSKSKFKLWLQNETFIPSKILGNDFLTNNRFLLRKKKIKILIGFPSAIAILAQFCIDQGDSPKDFAIKGVLTFAESLTASQRDVISKAFGCKVCSRYGTEELGILGCQYDNESGFTLNTCNYIIEVLKLNEDVSVLPGEMGRVVVTDLHSDAFPLIRYETGDLAVLEQVFDENKGWAKRLKALSGRIIQMLDATNGEKLYPLYLENIIEKHKHLFVQYQLIQESEKVFTLKLVPKTNFNQHKFAETALIKEMHGWLGKDALVHVRLVDDIEMLPSGKRPSIINKRANI